MPGKLVSKLAFHLDNSLFGLSLNREAREVFLLPDGFTTWSAARENSDPATGCCEGSQKHPLALNSSQALERITVPFCAWIRTGCVKKEANALTLDEVVLVGIRRHLFSVRR